MAAQVSSHLKKVVAEGVPVADNLGIVTASLSISHTLQATDTVISHLSQSEILQAITISPAPSIEIELIVLMFVPLTRSSSFASRAVCRSVWSDSVQVILHHAVLVVKACSEAAVTLPLTSTVITGICVQLP
jgi:archaellum biogenesis protein FlaJ (TadC family)